MTTVAMRRVEQDRERASPMAAVGRKNGRVGRPAVILRASVAPTTQEPDQDQDVVAVPERRPEAPDPAEEHAHDEDGQQQPADEARDVRASPGSSPSASIFSIRRSLIRSPLRTMTSPWRIETRTGATASAALVARLGGELLAERGVRHDERADQLGGEHPLGLVEAAGHPARPAGSGSRPPRVSRSSVRSGRVEDPGGLGPDDRPARRHRAPTSVARAASDRSGTAASSRRRAAGPA